MQTKKSEGTAGTSETENKKLTRGEVLQLLRVCWSQLMENGGNKRIEKKEGFLYYSMKLAETFKEVEELDEESHVQAIGFRYEEEEEEDFEDEEEDEDE